MMALSKSVNALIGCQRSWWSCDLPVGTKLSYYPAMARSFVRGRTRHVRYLGRKFTFDHPRTPIILQEYRFEISRRLLPYVGDPSALRAVLDIGGNIGQFTATLRHFLPHTHIDVFEPNPAVIPYLRDNVGDMQGVKVHPHGIAPVPIEAMYFEPGRSAVGSFILENAGGRRRQVVTVPVRTTNDVPALTGRSSYDLVKIDVEGYEAEVLAALRGIKARYLFLEVSTVNRRMPYRHSELFDLVRQRLGEFNILYQEPVDGNKTCFNLLMAFGTA